MKPHHSTVHEASTGLVAEPTVGAIAPVPQRSSRRATARRASARRATARQRKGHIERRIGEYLAGHPGSTVGELAKGLNVDRDAMAARLSRMPKSR